MPNQQRDVATNPLAGATALITGAGGGVGQAIACALGRQGMSLVLLGRDPTRLAATAARASGNAVQITCDLSNPRDIAAAAPHLPARLRVLVHSAGLFHHGPLLATGAQTWTDLTQVNLVAPLLLTSACHPALRAAGGDVVFINSTAGLRPGTGNGAYAAGKHALRAAADTLRTELAPDGIRVLSLFPGRIDTDMQARVLQAEARTLAPPLLSPDDIATVLLAALRLPAHAAVSEMTVRPVL